MILDAGRGAGRERPARVEATYHAALPDARLDRPVVRGRAAQGRRAHGLDAQPGRVSAARRDRRDAAACRPSSVRCIHMEGSGCYGHNGADDVGGRCGADRARPARHAGARAVDARARARVGAVRPRDGDEAHAPRSTPSGNDRRLAVRGLEQHALDAPGPARATCSPARLLGDSRSRRRRRKPMPQPEGGGDRNAIPLYTLPNARVVHHFMPDDAAARVGAARARRLHERVLDRELHGRARARGQGRSGRVPPAPSRGPARARRGQPRPRERSAGQRDRGRAARGRGFAFARYKNLAAYAAIAMEVEVERETGDVRVLRVVAAVDSGEAVNPDGIRNQIEGGIMQSTELDAVRGGDVRPHAASPAATGARYPILRFSQRAGARRGARHRPARPAVPRHRRSRAGPTAAALANAIADATGVRLRELPLSRTRIRNAIGV